MHKKVALAAASIGAFLFISSVAFAQSPVTDTFENYNTDPWVTFGGSAKLFEYDDGTSGDCKVGACIRANGESGTTPRIYRESGNTLMEGGLTVYARSKEGSGASPDGIIGLCVGTNTGCGDGNRLDFGGIFPDNVWHQYLVLWRQGVSSVEACTLKNSLEQANCNWINSGIALGNGFDGVALWSANGFRSDTGNELWFDELRGAVLLTLTSEVPPLSNSSAIETEARFSVPVTGFEASDITVDNGTVSNFTEVSGDVYTFDVTPTTDGLVIVHVSAGAAEDSDGNPSVSAAPLERTVDRSGPPVTILDKTTNELSPVMGGTIEVVGSTTVSLKVQAATYPADITGSNWSATIPEGTLTDGTYTAVAIGTDDFGNHSFATGTLIIDRTAPNLAITSGPGENSYTNQHTVNFGISSDAPITCAIDDAAPVSCSGSFGASGLESGTHVFVAESIDPVGNVAKKTRTWHIDTAAPIVTEVLAVQTPALDTTPDYIFNTTKAGTIHYGGSCSSATFAAAQGDNTITFNELNPGTYSDCTLTVTDAAGNISEPLAVSSFTINTPPPAEEVITLSAAADTYIRKGASDTNEGASPIIRIRQGGDNRGLVRFDQAAIAAAVGNGTVLSASLEFTIEETKNNWGKQGREVGAHRLLMPWTEGNGKNAELPGHQSFRGTGAGVTWECAKDTNINNHKTDCAAADNWEMRLKKTTPSERPWVAEKTDSIFLQKKQEGVVAFDVTADVQKYLSGTSNHGWIIRKEEENKGGYVTFFSKESAGAAPELILTIRR